MKYDFSKWGKKKITLGFYESSLCKFRIIWIVLVLLRMSMLSKQKFRTFQLLKALVEKKKKKGADRIQCIRVQRTWYQGGNSGRHQPRDVEACHAAGDQSLSQVQMPSKERHRPRKVLFI